MEHSFIRIALRTLAAITLLCNPSLAAAQTVAVYKSPTCGCCTGWVDYLRDNHFDVQTHDLENLDGIKQQYGVEPSLQSCHTAIVDGYVVEGHVPVEDIRRLIQEKPDIEGISAPGMPAMSPGMASLIPKNYNVLSFDAERKVEIFSQY